MHVKNQRAFIVACLSFFLCPTSHKKLLGAYEKKGLTCEAKYVASLNRRTTETYGDVAHLDHLHYENLVATVEESLVNNNLDFFAEKLDTKLLCEGGFLHKMFMPRFRRKSGKYMNPDTRMGVLSIIMETFTTKEVLIDLSKEAFKGKTAFAWAMQKPAWSKGVLFLLSKGWVDPSEYKLLGISRTWYGKENQEKKDEAHLFSEAYEGLLFNQTFGAGNLKLANQAFLHIIESWKTYFKHDEVKREDTSLLFAICSLQNHFTTIKSHQGFPWIWTYSYYYDALLFLFEQGMARTEEEKETTTLIVEKVGDLYYLKVQYKSAAQKYSACLALGWCSADTRTSHYQRIAKKLASCYKRSYQTKPEDYEALSAQIRAIEAVRDGSV